MDDIEKICDGMKSITIEKRGDLTVLVVENAFGHAEVLTQGAQLIAYTPRGEKPVIWHSKDIFYTAGTPIRGGIPIIGPWFNALDSNPQAVEDHVGKKEGAPSHGFLRDVQWNLIAANEEKSKTIITWRFQHVRNDLWNRHFTAEITYEIGIDIKISLTIENTDDADMTYASALHTYFAISDVAHVHSPSFDDVSYIDTLDEQKKKVWKGDMIIDQERDYNFIGTREVQEIIDKTWHRKIVLETKGSNSTVLWNPWIEKSKGLSMFGDDEYKEMFCIESANIADDVVIIKSGEKHVLELQIQTMAL